MLSKEDKHEAIKLFRMFLVLMALELIALAGIITVFSILESIQ